MKPIYDILCKVVGIQDAIIVAHAVVYIMNISHLTSNVQVLPTRDQSVGFRFEML